MFIIDQGSFSAYFWSMVRLSAVLSAIIILIVMNSSCTTTKYSTYFNNAKDTSFLELPTNREHVIKSNDMLSIAVSSLNHEASAIFNSTNGFTAGSSTVAGTYNQSSGYLVDADGNIQLPLLGSIRASGLTKDELKKNITESITDKRLLVDPVVHIRHLNFEVTVIGEVGHPTVITVPNEKISMLKALGLAGDITIYGKKNNVLLVREEGDKKIVRYIDLNSKNFLTSPYYYLQPNDIVYVEANKNKVASAGRITPFLPAILSGLSVVILVLDRVIQ